MGKKLRYSETFPSDSVCPKAGIGKHRVAALCRSLKKLLSGRAEQGQIGPKKWLEQQT